MYESGQLTDIQYQALLQSSRTKETKQNITRHLIKIGILQFSSQYSFFADLMLQYWTLHSPVATHFRMTCPSLQNPVKGQRWKNHLDLYENHQIALKKRGDNGVHDRASRPHVEERVYHYPFDTPAVERPSYGLWHHSSSKFGQCCGRGYFGDSYFGLHPMVYPRITLSTEDSFKHTCNTYTAEHCRESNVFICPYES